MKKLDRRQLLALVMVTTGEIIGSYFWQNRRKNNLSWANLPDGEGKVYQSKNGLLEVDLIAGYSDVIIDNQKVSLLTYNGQIPAPV